MTDHISFTSESLAELKKAYEKAVQEGASVFVYAGHKLVTAYAKYLIVYLDRQFGGGK